MVILHFSNTNIRMPGFLHHSPKICGFLVPSVELKLTVSCDQQNRGSLAFRVIERSEFIDDCLLPWDPSFLTDGKVCDGMSTERNEPGDSLRVQIMGFEKTGVHPDHTCEVTTGGVAADKNGVGGTAESVYISNRPSNHSHRIFDVNGSFDSWPQAVVCRDHDDFLPAKG